MRYLLALILPPVAVLICGKPFQFVLNLLLCLLLIVPGVIHALLVVHDYQSERRNQKIIDALKERA